MADNHQCLHPDGYIETDNSCTFNGRGAWSAWGACVDGLHNRTYECVDAPVNGGLAWEFGQGTGDCCAPNTFN